MSARYFSGLASHLGQVHELPHQTFAELVEATVAKPVQLALTRPQMFALPDKAQNEAKRTAYLVPAVFKTNPSPRQTDAATHCNLLFVDIDDGAEAERILNVGPATLLGDLAAVVWHTARSTPDKPRLRIMVSTENLPVNQYSRAVTALAGLLGMSSVTHESKVAVQPMYVPVQYAGDTTTPLVYDNPNGTAFDHATLAALDNLRPAAPPEDADLGDIEYLRAPVDNITTEEITEALTKIDASCSMQSWVEVGMGLKHQFGPAGFILWDEWSATSNKYPGREELQKRWDSFAASPAGRAPITIRSVIHSATENGWDNRALTSRLFETTREWIKSDQRSSEELLDQGGKRIAKLDTMIGALERKVLLSDLHAATKARGLRGPTVQDLSREVQRLTQTANRAANSAPPWTVGIAFLTAPNLFYRYLDRRKMRGEVVDLIYRSPDPTQIARQYLVHDVGIPVVENLRYAPAEKKRLFSSGGVPYLNTYFPSFAPPDASQSVLAGDHWKEHAINLVGIDYWVTFTDWLAYQAQSPGHKIRWAPIIQSAMGGGKGLSAYVATLVLGNSNVQRLAAEHVLGSTHNGWAVGYQLSVIDEAHNVGASRHGVADKVKPLISDDFVSVRQLYEPVVTAPNTTNYIIFTNHFDSLAVHGEDRRYWVINSPLKDAASIAKLGADYFERMYSTFAANAGGLRHFFENWKISPTFKPEGRAPVTPFLADLAKQTASPLARAVAEALEDEPTPLVRRDLVSLTELRQSLPSHRLPAFTDQGLSGILRDKGFTDLGRHPLNGERHSLWTTRDEALAVTLGHAQARLDLF
jgi:hypothetical protein